MRAPYSPSQFQEGDMAEDMPRPRCWVSISLHGDKHFVHVREDGERRVLGPFPSNREAAVSAKRELARLRPAGNSF